MMKYVVKPNYFHITNQFVLKKNDFEFYVKAMYSQ